MRHAFLALTAAVSLSLSLPAMAQESASASSASKCATLAPLPVEFKGFDAPLKQAAALTSEAAPTISLGTAYRLDLSPALGLAYISAPKKPPEDGRYAGLATFTVTKDATYSVATSEGIWIDIYSGTEVIRSNTFGRVECSIIHKVVNFPLKPGTYKLQLSNSPVAAVTIMITPKP